MEKVAAAAVAAAVSMNRTASRETKEGIHAFVPEKERKGKAR